MDFEMILHTVHLLGEKNEHLANLTNIFFSIALVHGGCVVLKKHAHKIKGHAKRIMAKHHARQKTKIEAGE